MNREEFCKILYSLVKEWPDHCDFYALKNGRVNVYVAKTQIQDCLFFNLDGYSSTSIDLPDGIYEVKDTFTNGAKLLKQAE